VESALNALPTKSYAVGHAFAGEQHAVVSAATPSTANAGMIDIDAGVSITATLTPAPVNPSSLCAMSAAGHGNRGKELGRSAAALRGASMHGHWPHGCDACEGLDLVDVATDAVIDKPLNSVSKA